MESSDSTLAIAEAAGCRILAHENCGYADPARDFAMRNAKHDWVFFVDADEIVPPQLCRWIASFVDNPGKVKGVFIPRKNGYLNSWNRGTYPDYQMRLLDRRKSTWPAFVHSNPVVDGRIYKIPRKQMHLAMFHKPPTMEEIMERLNRYTTLEMERKTKMKVTWFKLWYRPKVRFFKSFILKGGFRNGIVGYMAARQDAFYQHFYLTKIYEHNLGKKS